MKKNSEKQPEELVDNGVREAELLADLQRTRADFENYRKQVEAQRAAAVKIGQFATVNKILPLIDDMERAISTYQELAPLGKTLSKTLKELGLVKIPTEAGVDFNPDTMDAVMVEGDGECELVAETLRTGYRYDNEVLRPAMVKVVRQ